MISLRDVDWSDFEKDVQREYEERFVPSFLRTASRKSIMLAYDSKTKTLRDLKTGEIFRWDGRWIKA